MAVACEGRMNGMQIVCSDCGLAVFDGPGDGIEHRTPSRDDPMQHASIKHTVPIELRKHHPTVARQSLVLQTLPRDQCGASNVFDWAHEAWDRRVGPSPQWRPAVAPTMFLYGQWSPNTSSGHAKQCN